MRAPALAILVAVLFARGSATARAEEPDPGPNEQAFTLLADARTEVHRPAMSLLIERAERSRVAKELNAATIDAVRDRLRGVLYGIDVAERFAAATAGSTARFMTFEEWMRSDWMCLHVAVLRRARLAPQEALEFLSERAQARLEAQRWIDTANETTSSEALARVVPRRPALVPHLLSPLAVNPWLASHGWPHGGAAVQERSSLRALVALKAREAVPYALFAAQTHSPTVEWDAITALGELTDDAGWRADRGPRHSSDGYQAWLDRRWTWWAKEGKAYADAARWFALDSLRTTRDYLVASIADPSSIHLMKFEYFPGVKPVDPHARLLDAIGRMTGYNVPNATTDMHDLRARLNDVVTAIRHFEASLPAA